MNNIMLKRFALFAATAALAGNIAHAQRLLTSSTPITENFLSYLGTAATVPADFIVEGESGDSAGHSYKGVGNGSEANSGFYSYGNAVDGRSFGILEGDQGNGDLGDSRLVLFFKNDTGAALTRLRVSYKVQIWRDGARLNRIKLKYNTTNGGFSSLPELVDTPAKINAGNTFTYNGNSPTYYTQVTTDITLPSSLADQATAYIRWQFSSSGDSGKRDGLGIADISISAVPSGVDKTWAGTTSAWNLVDAVWGSGPAVAWDNAGNYNALFGGTGSLVTLANNITATDVDFSVNGYEIAGGGNTLTLTGRVDVASGITAEISAPIAGASGLLKTGTGILELSGTNVFTGTLAIDAGTVKPLAATAIPDTSILQVGDNAVFDLNNQDITIAGVQGDSLGEVVVSSGHELILQINASASYKGKITGAGQVTKIGSGRQRFRNVAKTYTGLTVVGDGQLEITENGIPTGTSGVVIAGGLTTTELLMTTDNALGSTFAFGPSGASLILLADNGQLASDTDKIITLTNPIEFDSAGAIYARGTTATAKLTLNGAITGAGSFRRQGQAELVINGNASAYSGAITLKNGLTTVASGKTLGTNTSTISVENDGGSPVERARLAGAGTVGGSVTYNGGEIRYTASSPTLVIKGNLSGLSTATLTPPSGSGSRDLFRVEGTVSGSLPAGVSLVSASPLAGNYVRFTY